MADEPKSTVQHGRLQNDDLEPALTHGTYLAKDEIASLSEEHRQYLLKRHGTLELDPVPLKSDADPYNWPSWKVRIPQTDSYHYLCSIENHQSYAGCLPRLHVNIYRSRNNSRVRINCRRSEDQHTASLIPHFTSNCHHRRCATLLEAALDSIWSQAHLHPVAHRQFGVQRCLCENNELRINGHMPCVYVVLHFSRLCHRQCRRGRDVL
jgi:hypothetical protein